jgi:ABC-2 type transport system permease protein
MTSEAFIPVPSAVRSGPTQWWRGLSAMLRWHLTSMRLFLPVLVVVQMLVAAGFSVGISLFFVDAPHTVGLYLGTGASIIALILVGLVVAPQLIASEKEEGTYDFSWSLPVPRSAAVVAWVGLCAIVSLPSMVMALLVAAWRLDLVYTISWSIVPAVALVLVCGTMIGYALAHAIERPSLTQLLSQVLAFGILGFTPITYPIENLPGWLSTVHKVLPFYHMGVLVRGGLTQGMVEDISVSYLIVLGWSLIAVLLTALVLGRRR